VGLILPGGGARNAYQVGVLKAIAEILPDDAENPFPVICGTSSGAINAALVASAAGQFHPGIERLVGLWENFHVGKVFKADVSSTVHSALRWAKALVSGGMVGGGPQSVLDSQPLRELLESHVRFARIQQLIDNGTLRALSVTTSTYTSGSSITYYQGASDIQPWERTRRRGIAEEITVDHLMASAAIPIVFPAVRLHNEYHADGSMRESTPLSPALHMGANRLLIIGARNPVPDTVSEKIEPPYPSLAQVIGYVLDTLFMDSLDSDIERLNRINHTIGNTKDKRVAYQDSALRQIEFLVISPSHDIREIAERHQDKLPRTVRWLLKGLGALSREGRPLMSYLLFEQDFCRELIELGYQDAMHQRDDIVELLGDL